MNNVIKTDFHTFNTSLLLKPLKYFYNCETRTTNGFASIFEFLHQTAAERVLLSQALLKFTFPVSSFVLSFSFKHSSVYPVWISTSHRQLSLSSSSTAEPLPVGLQCQAMTPMCLPVPPSSPAERSSDLAAGYLANHTKLILVPLKPGDYEGFPLCLFV